MIGPMDNIRPIPPGDTVSGRLPPVAAPVIGHGTTPGEAGVVGVSDQFEGVHGVSHSPGHAGVFGHNDGGNVGVWGESTRGEGVRGVSHSAHGAVVGVNDKDDGRGDAAWFESKAGEGCHGVSHSPDFGGVFGYNDGGSAGVWGESTKFDGVIGMSHSPDHAGVSGHNDQGGPAGWFGGNVIVTGDIEVTTGEIRVVRGDIKMLNADCAEEFTVSETEEVEPGTVMVIDQGGTLRQSHQPYDKRVAGVISGAGGYKPAITLDRQRSEGNRMPVALLGKVYCKVDAQYSPIEVGDLLTTSFTPGHAMKAEDSLRAFGAVIGKALRPLRAGRELIPVLVALQ